MLEQISVLEFVWRVHKGGGGKTESYYLDFVIDGLSLHDRLNMGDSVGCLRWSGWHDAAHEQELAEVLLLRRPSPLVTGRAMLYVCSECGDIGCGALTAHVEKTSEYFVWSDFGYENDYDPSTPDLMKYRDIGPYRFDKTNYWQSINHRPTTLASSPIEERSPVAKPVKPDINPT